MKIHILGRNALNCALYLEFNVFKIKKEITHSKRILFKTKKNNHTNNKVII